MRGVLSYATLGSLAATLFFVLLTFSTFLSPWPSILYALFAFMQCPLIGIWKKERERVKQGRTPSLDKWHFVSIIKRLRSLFAISPLHFFRLFTPSYGKNHSSRLVLHIIQAKKVTTLYLFMCQCERGKARDRASEREQRRERWANNERPPPVLTFFLSMCTFPSLSQARNTNVKNKEQETNSRRAKRVF